MILLLVCFGCLIRGGPGPARQLYTSASNAESGGQERGSPFSVSRLDFAIIALECSMINVTPCSHFEKQLQGERIEMHVMFRPYLPLSP